MIDPFIFSFFFTFIICVIVLYFYFDFIKWNKKRNQSIERYFLNGRVCMGDSTEGSLNVVLVKYIEEFHITDLDGFIEVKEEFIVLSKWEVFVSIDDENFEFTLKKVRLNPHEVQLNLYRSMMGSSDGMS